MQLANAVSRQPVEEDNPLQMTVPGSNSGLTIAVLTGCQDRHYAFGLTMALAEAGVSVEAIGSDEIDSPEFHSAPNVRFLEFVTRKSVSNEGLLQKIWRVIGYYARVLRYVPFSSAQVIHILWNYKLELLDRTLLMLYFKMFGKRIALTAHNVNQARRDSNDSWLNRISLKCQYRLCDQIFVHTAKMKKELCEEFGVAEQTITVIPYPVNNALPETGLTSLDAKKQLGLRQGEKVILFFGRLVPYKGLEFLLEAFRLMVQDQESAYRLIIAGEPQKGSERYLNEIRQTIDTYFGSGRVISRMQFIPDEETEIYLKAADVLVLPYKDIFQSGILFLAYSFGLPVVATDVGSFREVILEGETGFISRSAAPEEIAKTIQIYFGSDLYKNLDTWRPKLRDYVNLHHSWAAVAELISHGYLRIWKVNPRRAAE